MAKANDASVAAEDKTLVEVRLLKGYVPAEAEFEEVEETFKGKPIVSKIYEKVQAGSVIALPRDEARRAIQLGIAIVDADLI